MVDMASLMDDQITVSQHSFIEMKEEIERLQQRIKELEVRVRYFESITTGAEHDAIDRLCSPSPEDKYL